MARYRRNDGFDPVPWIVGAIVAAAAYELYRLITGSSGAPQQPTAVPAAGSGEVPGAYAVPGEGGGANF
jgi:hypothetical protein